MNRILLIVLASLSLLAAIPSCVIKKKAGKENPIRKEQVAQQDVSVFDRLKNGGAPVMLGQQKLTAEGAVEAAFEITGNDYLKESTPVEATFFFPEQGLGFTPTVQLVQLHYNYANVLNRVLHAYEWFCRQPGDAEEVHTRKDTLDWIRQSQPAIRQALLRSALQDRTALKHARRLLETYRSFDGDDSEGSAFSKAYQDYLEGYNVLPSLVTEEELDMFEEDFWRWYDKRRHVPEIDDLIKTHLQGSRILPDSLELEPLRKAAMGERDIDRRAILALELIQHDPWDGALLLGDIMESGVYTKYLLEVWISWRAHLQMYFSPSSFGVIPNNYYDRLRVKCMNTMLKHIQVSDDEKEEMYARCLLQNLILSQIVHRQGSISGNDSMAICMHLAYDMFIHPRLLTED